MAIQDEILDVSGQPDTDPRYTIKDNEGTIIRDNVKIELKTPIIQEGTIINKQILESLRELLPLTLVEKEDISTPTKSSINGRITTATANATNWPGTCIGNQPGGSSWPFSMSSDDLGMTITGTSSSSYIRVFPFINGSSDLTLSGLKTILARKEYDSDYYLSIGTDTASQNYLYMTWDLHTSCVPTFRYRNNASYTLPVLQGSNDNSIWTDIDNLVDNAAKNIVPSTAYRYFRVKFPLKGSSGAANETHAFHYGYFTNVPDTIQKYRNKFTVDDNIIEHKMLNYYTPATLNMSYVTENTINDINCVELLQQNSSYDLEKVGSNIQYHKRTVTGTYTGNSSASQSIDLGFKPDLLIVGTKNITGQEYGIVGVFTKDGFIGENRSSGSSSGLGYSSNEGLCSLTNTGFTANNGIHSDTNFPAYNYSGTVYNYIAIKF